MVRIPVFVLLLLVPISSPSRRTLAPRGAGSETRQRHPDQHSGGSRQNWKQGALHQKGCNLNVPLLSEDIKVAILGKIKNACSYPEGVPATHWSRKLKPLEGKWLEVKGVLRVWLENPPKGGKKQCECDAPPRYTSSNPNHMVELHPLTAIGNISFLNMTRDVQKGDTSYLGYRGGKLPTTLNKMKISVRRVKKADEVYISIKGTKSRYSDWTILVVVMGIAEQRNGGHAFEVAVVHRDGFMERDLRALTIEGTAADREVERLEVNDEVVLSGLMRLDLASIDKEAGWAWKTIPMPYEMIVLNIMK
jgi:hypothetical protein